MIVSALRLTRCSLLPLLTIVACSGEQNLVSAPLPPPPTAPLRPGADVGIREIVHASLPSPFYRFAYDSTGRLESLSYASDLRQYEIVFHGKRMIAMQSVGFLRDRLAYHYDALDRVRSVTYQDGMGRIYASISFTYAGNRLVGLERQRRIEGSFQLEKKMTFIYGADGNLAELTDERLPVGAQTAATLVDRFERYDTGVNVDDFTLVHSEFFDHPILLPGVRLQFGNPGAVTRSGSGLNYHIEYSYTYDSRNRPLARRGDLLFHNGVRAGERFQTSSTYTYE